MFPLLQTTSYLHHINIPLSHMYVHKYIHQLLHVLSVLLHTRPLLHHTSSHHLPWCTSSATTSPNCAQLGSVEGSWRGHTPGRGREWGRGRGKEGGEDKGERTLFCKLLACTHTRTIVAKTPTHIEHTYQRPFLHKCTYVPSKHTILKQTQRQVGSMPHPCPTQYVCTYLNEQLRVLHLLLLILCHLPYQLLSHWFGSGYLGNTIWGEEEILLTVHPSMQSLLAFGPTTQHLKWQLHNVRWHTYVHTYRYVFHMT